uniref:DNA packaging protein 2 n=1 Tax=Elephant endotheliotropic herpesvirus 1A TaxID=759753 RepID=E2IKW8_ELHV1|nr:DNA packaging protein 2 [Elephant endotheliotropic herpesvirus 1A]QOE74715.1 DNA packaging protein 2 [Elephant endotheliotropic herpesvirus 1A]
MSRFMHFYKSPVPLVLQAHKKNCLVYTNLRTRRLRLLAQLNQREKELKNQDFRVGHEKVINTIDEIRTFLVDNHDDIIESIDGVIRTLKDIRPNEQGSSNTTTGHNVTGTPTQSVASGTGTGTGTGGTSSVAPDANMVADKTVTITMADKPFEYRDSFRDEFIATMYNATLRSYTMGDWYSKLKQKIYDEERYRRRFKVTHPESPAISYELVCGQVQILDLVTVYPTTDIVITDIQSAICILWTLYNGILNTTLDLSVTFEEVFEKVPGMLDVLEAEIKKENGNTTLFGTYSFADNEDIVFYNPPKDKRYSPRTFENNVIVRLLYRLRCIQNMPNDPLGAAAQSNLGIGWDEDRLFRVCRKLLTGIVQDVPIFLHKQYYLRSGCTCISALLYVKCFLDSTSVFSPSDRKFSLDTFLPNANTYVDASDYRGRNIKNFSFLWKKYVTQLYKDRPSITFSGIFPGAVLFSIAYSVSNNWLGPGHVQRPHPNARTVKLQLLHNQPLYSYLWVQHRVPRHPLEVLKAHDRALFYFEYGIHLLLNQPISFTTHRNTLKRQFNVTDVYELCYFFVLGFVPVELII